MVQRRMLDTARGQFSFRVIACPPRAFLLREGTAMKYGARHWKRSIERHLVYPLANLLATEQVRLGDILCIDWDEGGKKPDVREGRRRRRASCGWRLRPLRRTRPRRVRLAASSGRPAHQGGCSRGSGPGSASPGRAAPGARGSPEKRLLILRGLQVQPTPGFRPIARSPRGRSQSQTWLANAFLFLGVSLSGVGRWRWARTPPIGMT